MCLYKIIIITMIIMKDETNRRLVFEVAASPDEMSAPDPAMDERS